MPRIRLSLAGKVAIVTGGSRGIGRAVALGLAEAGADVCVAARSLEPLVAVAETIRGLGRRGLAVPVAVADVVALERLVETARRELGRVDILVNNAAIGLDFGPIARLSEQAWDSIMAINVKSGLLLAKFAREAILAHGEGGAIVNVSSIGARRASPVRSAYSVSKAALDMLTKVLAKEWGADGIRVNGVAPGPIQTEFSREQWSDERTLRGFLSQSPLRRVGQPEDLVGAVVYLAGPAASFVTGQTLVVDGGATL